MSLPVIPKCVIDADVLIDYALSDLGILRLYTDHIAQINVPTRTLQQVSQLDEKAILEHHLHIYYSETDQLLEAQSIHESRPALDFVDTLGFVVARDEGAQLITNDKLLREYCKSNGIKTIRGLRLMIQLNHRKLLEKLRAIDVAKTIIANNKRMNEELLRDFTGKLI